MFFQSIVFKNLYLFQMSVAAVTVEALVIESLTVRNLKPFRTNRHLILEGETILQIMRRIIRILRFSLICKDCQVFILNVQDDVYSFVYKRVVHNKYVLFMAVFYYFLWCCLSIFLYRTIKILSSHVVVFNTYNLYNSQR